MVVLIIIVLVMFGSVVLVWLCIIKFIAVLVKTLFLSVKRLN